MLRKTMIAGLLLGACLSPGLARAQAAGACVPGPNVNCPADAGNSRAQESEPPRVGVSPDANPGHHADAGHPGGAAGASHGAGAHGGAGGGRGSGGGGGGGGHGK